MKRREVASDAHSSKSSMSELGNMAEVHRDTDPGLNVSSPSSRQYCTHSPISPDHLSAMSLEILCHIIDYLPLYDAMKLDSLSKKLHRAVGMHLRLTREVNMTEGQIFGTMSGKFNDRTLLLFLRRCTDVCVVRGLHPRALARRRQRGSEILSVPGVITALQHCPRLLGVETSDIFLLEALLSYLPHIEILSMFKNRNGCFPPPADNKLTLTRNAFITTLNLTGVVVPELPKMEDLKHLFLRWVQLTDPHPFRDFVTPNLETFIMNNCAGPVTALEYVPLMTGLATAHSLSRLELVRVPFLAGLIQHVVEESWPLHGFQQLNRVLVGSCKHVLEIDIGYLMITCKEQLEDLSLQPSLSKDSFFVSLTLAEVEFPKFETLHIGYVDSFPEFGKWSSEELSRHGLAEVSESPASISDVGMKAASHVLPGLMSLVIYNCPHLHSPTSWLSAGVDVWSSLTVLRLWRCHGIRLYDFCEMVPMLSSLKSLQLECMFREPPKGCSRVGLSAGTGLGVSAALVSNNGSTQNVGNQNDAAPAAQPPPPGAPPGPPPEEEEDPAQGSGNGAGLQAPPVDIPQNDIPVATGSSRDEHGGSAELSSNSTIAKSKTTTVCEAVVSTNSAEMQDTASSSSSPDKTTECIRSKAETSIESAAGSDTSVAENSNSREVPTSSRSQSLSNGQRQLDSTCANRADMDRYASACRGGPLQRNSTAAARAHGSDADRALQIQLVDNRGDGHTRNAAQFHLVDPGDRACDSGKGKGLVGSRKGVVKRSAPSRVVHQSCQAVSEEIRQSTKKAREEGEILDLNPCRVPLSSGGSSASSAGSSKASSGSRRSQYETEDGGDGEMFSKRVGGKRPKMCDQATSTSDPVIEDDHIQVLTLRSATLVNVSLFHVGITDLVVEETESLRFLTGCACRVLRNVLIRTAPVLARYSFTQCRKLRHEDLVDEVCQQDHDMDRVIILRPMQSYDATRMEKLIFSSPNYNNHLCLVHDYSIDPTQILKGQQEAADWLQIIAHISRELPITDWDCLEQHVCDMEDPSTTYPWGYPWARDIYRRYSHDKTPPYKLVSETVSDWPWWRELAASEEFQRLLQQEDAMYNKDVTRQTLDSCRTRDWLYRKACEVLQQQIAEYNETHLKLLAYSTLVYVNLCDIDGTLTPDLYL